MGRPNAGHSGMPFDVVAMTSLAVLDSPTAVDGPRLVGDSNEALEYAFWNDSGDTVTFTVSAGSDPTKLGSLYVWPIAVAPGGHEILQVPNMQMPRLIARYWTVTGQKALAGSAACRYQIGAVGRSR